MKHANKPLDLEVYVSATNGMARSPPFLLAHVEVYKYPNQAPQFAESSVNRTVQLNSKVNLANSFFKVRLPSFSDPDRDPMRVEITNQEDFNFTVNIN